MVGLHYLKHLCDQSDESVVEGFIENPYWQYFCGMEFFVHAPAMRSDVIGEVASSDRSRRDGEAAGRDDRGSKA